MQRQGLLRRVHEAVVTVEPTAQIILYGSRARADAQQDSDWDFLILLEGQVDSRRVDRVRHQLYDLELESEQLLSSIVLSLDKWRAPHFQASPFSRAVQHEGVPI